MAAPTPRFSTLEPPERRVPATLALYLRLANAWAQVGAAALGFGLGLLVLAAGTGRPEGAVPALLVVGMGAVMDLSGRGARRRRLRMLRSAPLAVATVRSMASNAGGGDYRQLWSLRLTFADGEGRERRTSHHDDFRRGLAVGATVELFYDPATPLDTTPEGERPRVPEERWPLLAVELPRGVATGPDGRLLPPGPVRLAAVLAGFLGALALPLWALARALARG